MPVGEPITLPLPATLTSSVYWVCANVAVTLCAAFMVTTQLPTPLQAPPQPLKLPPAAATAVSATCVPAANPTLHVDGQSTPAGELVTTPLPLTFNARFNCCA